jgi:hypothetical protein
MHLQYDGLIYQPPRQPWPPLCTLSTHCVIGDQLVTMVDTAVVFVVISEGERNRDVSFHDMILS